MDSYKTCETCKASKSRDNFIGTQHSCYKCVFLEKKHSIAVDKNRVCKICDVILDESRWRYCSDQCAKEGKRQNKHWTSSKRLNSCSKGHKRRFLFYGANRKEEF